MFSYYTLQARAANDVAYFAAELLACWKRLVFSDGVDPVGAVEGYEVVEERVDRRAAMAGSFRLVTD